MRLAELQTRMRQTLLTGGSPTRNCWRCWPTRRRNANAGWRCIATTFATRC